MPQGGQSDITTSNHTLDDKRASQLGLAPGEYVKVSVKDNGCGIPEEAQKMVFEPFFSTKEAGKGSGSGLSMVYGFVDQSGRLSGIQLARQAQSMYPQLKVLMTSGYARDDDQIDLAALPQLHLIKKPYHLEDLRRELRRLLDR